MSVVDEVTAPEQQVGAGPAEPEGPPAVLATAVVEPPTDPEGTEPDLRDPVIAALERRLAALDDRCAEADQQIGLLGGQLGSTADDLTAARAAQNAEESARSAHIGALADRMADLDSRLTAVDGAMAGLRERLTQQDRALEDVTRTIAIEVERHTTDALVDSRHGLQLAVNSIAQLALAMGESSRDLTEDVSAESAIALLDSFRVDLDAILAQLGYLPLGTGSGAAFDPHRHRALRRVRAADPAQDKVITQVIRDGYLSAATGRILLFADVEVGRYQP